MHLAGILIIALIVLIIILMTNKSSSYRNAPAPEEKIEEFGDVLGALGPYQAQIAAAIDQTRQTDPSKRLEPGNDWNAGMYIQSTFTDMARKGIPPQEPITIISRCTEQCKSNDPLASQKCTGMCYCRENCRVSCEIDCEYTDEPRESCLRGCMATKTTNCNQFAWGFADH